MESSQLKVIKDRAEKASPGEWLVKESNIEDKFNVVKIFTENECMATSMSLEDAELIAHARSDILNLISHYAQLKEQLIDTSILLSSKNTELRESNEASILELRKENFKLRKLLISKGVIDF